jgi:SAM-dependent methyltransferase
VERRDWVSDLKHGLKRHPRLALLLFYLTDLLYLRTGERRRFLRAFPPGARLVNVGAGFRPSPRGFLGIDREPYPHVHVRGDVGALPFGDGSVDGVLCEVVLEHVPDARGAIRELHRILRPGGELYVTIPFLWPYHASPHDYRRWTAAGVERDFAAFELVAKGISGGPTTALCNVLHEWLALVLSLNIEPLYRILYLALAPILFPFKLLDLVIARHRQAEKIAALYYVRGRKPRAAAAD